MLSDEEIISLNRMKLFVRSSVLSVVTAKDMDIVVTLVEKQSKEIEELRNEVMEKELIIDGMKEDRRIAVEEIQEQYYVSKDKIKAKIEEYEEKIKKIKEKDVWEEPYDTEKYVRYTNYISVLQSLLEKE